MGLRDEDSTIDPMGVEEIFVDGFSEHTIINGNMSCLGYRIHRDTGGRAFKVARVRLIWPASSTDEAIAEARKAQASLRAIESGTPIKRH